MNTYPLKLRSKATAFFLILVSIFLVYMDTFQVSWHFDDFPNILNNKNVHLSELTYSSIKKTFYASLGDEVTLNRPVAYFTFALNWFFGQDAVFGYHLVNLMLHFTTASILFLTILTLFQTPRLINKYQNSEYAIALLAVMLWSLNPIQTQAVTYIVQRMAVLAAFFSIAGIYFYIKGRLMKYSFKQVLMFLLCFLCFLLALGSKENALMMPVSLFLVEACFFQVYPIAKKIRQYFLAAILAGLLFLLWYVCFFMGKDSFISLFNGYELRPFTLAERLLTSPQIIFFYLGQIFYPLPGQFAITHDITVSTSLFIPWTTFPSFIGIFFLICAGLLLIRKNCLVSFAVLFYLVNHIIESSFLPLELIFEHRNYLPTLFLFVPVAAYLISLLDHCHKKKSPLRWSLIIFIIFLITGSGISTYTRNQTWLTEASIWNDAMIKYPKLATPQQKIAAYHQSQNQLEVAEKLYLESLTLKAQRPEQSIVLALNNLGNIYSQKQDYTKAIALYENALKIYPENERAIYNMVLALIRQKKWETASEHIDKLLLKQCDRGRYQNIKGFILVKQARYQEALNHLRHALHMSPSNPAVKINIGAVLSLMGYNQRADWFLNRAFKDSPNDILILFAQIENSIRSGNAIKTDIYLEKLFQTFPAKIIIKKLKKFRHDDTTVPIAINLIMPAIAKKMMRLSHEIENFN